MIPRREFAELILLDATAREYTELGQLAVFGEDEKGVYAHPTFVGTRACLRGSGSVVCVELGGWTATPRLVSPAGDPITPHGTDRRTNR